MSLINQVLADLSQRKSGQPLPASGVLIGTVLAASLPTPRYTHYLPFIAAVAAVIVCVVLLWPSTDYAVRDTYNSTAVPNVEEYAEDDIQLKLSSQLSYSENKQKQNTAPVLSEKIKSSVVFDKKSVVNPSLSKQLDDVFVKEITTFAPGHKKQVGLLLSGNVNSISNSVVSQTQAGSKKSYTVKQLDYVPVLALDQNMKLANDQMSFMNKNSETRQPQPVTKEHVISDRKQYAQVSDVSKKNAVLNQQPRQNKPIRQMTDVQRAEQVYQRALTLNAKGEVHQAIVKLREALSLNNAHLKARYTIAALLINTNQPDDALKELVDGMNIQPDYAPFAKLYGRLLMNRGELDDAIVVMERARGNAQRDAEYYAQLAAIYQQKGLHSEATAYYKQALRWQSSVGVWWMGLGISLEQQKQIRDAVIAYQRANATGTLSEDVLGYVKSRIKSLEMWK